VLPPGDPDDCSAAFTSLYGPRDTCALLIRRLILEKDISALGQFNQVSSDCSTRFQNFFTRCSEIYEDDPPTEVCVLICYHLHT